MRRVLPVLGVGVLALAAWARLGTGAVGAVVYDVPPVQEHGGTPGSLADIVRVEVGGHAPEDVEVDADGWLTTGVYDGRVLRISPDGGTITTLTDTGGRPLGLHRLGDGRLLVGDTELGLLAVDDAGVVEALSPAGPGGPHFVDDIETGPDGAVYFSDASARFTFHEWKRDLIAGTCTGRVFRWTRESGTTLLLDGLCFANGVAVHPTGEFLLVSETGRYRVMRLWLTGSRAGQIEPFLTGLPGFPDGVSSTPRGTFWVALASPRNPVLDSTAGLPGLRAWMDLLPAALQPKPERHPRVLEVDAQGTVLRDLQDPDGTTYGVITSAQEVDGRLWFGSLTESALGRGPVVTSP